jgi:hypothetical protein
MIMQKTDAPQLATNVNDKERILPPLIEKLYKTFQDVFKEELP